MDFQYNRKLAWAVLAVCAVGSIFGFGGGKIASEHGRAVEVFNEGTESYSVRSSIDAYLDNAAGYAATMAEEFKLRTGAESTTATEVTELASQITDGDIAVRYTAYTALQTKIESLYTEFYSSGVSDEDAKIFHNAYADFGGEVNKIGYDEYHTLAKDYNKLTQGFPASVVSAVFGMGNLESFQ